MSEISNYMEIHMDRFNKTKIEESQSGPEDDPNQCNKSL